MHRTPAVIPRRSDWRTAAWLCVLSGWLFACDPVPRTAPVRPTPTAPTGGGGFTEVAIENGLDFVHSSGAGGEYQLPEIMGAGCAWIDYDGDGNLDVYLINSSNSPEKARNRLYRNHGDGTFAEVDEAAGAADAGFGMGCAVGDYDRDGDPDLYVTNFGPNALYRNDGGVFVATTVEAGVGDTRWGASAVFVDIDNDGWLDLFVTNYMVHPPRSRKPCSDSAGRQEYCGPNTHFPPARDTLYRNQGDGLFVDVTRQAGLGNTFGNGLGVVCGDLNNDGHVDLYVANDATANQLWIGDGAGHFDDRAVEWGAAYNQNGQSEAGMGVQAEDVDGDSQLDLFVTHLSTESNTFYRGLPAGRFEDWTHATGLGPPSLPHTGFGVGFLDADHDGDFDLLVTNGGVRRGRRAAGVTLPAPWDRYAERDQFFEHLAPAANAGGSAGSQAPGERGLRFTERSNEVGLGAQPPHLGRGLALGDYDNDGDVDALVTACGGQVRLYRNDLPKRGNWLMVEPHLADGGGWAYGATVEVRAAGNTWRRYLQPAYSYLASNDPRLHFGLGDATRASVVVTWPNGSRVERETDVNQRLQIRQVEATEEKRRLPGDGGSGSEEPPEEPQREEGS